MIYKFSIFKGNWFLHFCFLHCAKFQFFVLKHKKQKSKDFNNFFALKNTKLLVLKHKKFVQTPTKQKIKSGCGFATPTFNNNLINDDFGFNKPICKFDNNKIL